jgi:hypothetical protein
MTSKVKYSKTNSLKALKCVEKDKLMRLPLDCHGAFKNSQTALRNYSNADLF